MTKFEVVERKNWVSVGRLSKGRILYKGKSLIPMRMHSVMGGGLDAAGGVGGAIVGGVLLGGVGALAGGAFGAAGGKVTCLVQVASGEQLLCRTTKSEFPNLHRQLLEAVEAFPRQLEQVSAKNAEIEAKGLPGFSLMRIVPPKFSTRRLPCTLKGTISTGSFDQRNFALSKPPQSGRCLDGLKI